MSEEFGKNHMKINMEKNIFCDLGKNINFGSSKIAFYNIYLFSEHHICLFAMKLCIHVKGINM
jgi:hypothetical protein